MLISEYRLLGEIIDYHRDCATAGIEPAKQVKFTEIRYERMQTRRQEERAVRTQKRELRGRVREYYKQHPEFRGNSEELAAELNVDPGDVNYRRLTASLRYQQRLRLLTDQRGQEAAD